MKNKILGAALAAKLRGATKKYIQKLQQIADRKNAITTYEGFVETGRLMRPQRFTSEWGKREDLHPDTVIVGVYITGIHIDFIKDGRYALKHGKAWVYFKSLSDAEIVLWKRHIEKFKP